MGTWGVEPFENDAALDFVGDLEDLADATDAVADRLRVNGLSSAELDVWDAEEIVAAAALVAGMSGFAGLGIEEYAGSVVLDRDRHDELRRLVQPAVDLIAAPGSQLMGEWDDAGESHAFLSGLRRIRDACLIA